jgi:hypothetical protein
MNNSILDVIGALALMAPFLAIAAILVHYFLQRAIAKRKLRQGKSVFGFCPSSFALGTALQFMPMFYRPSVAYVIEIRRVETSDEDDEGDPETPAKHLHRQLRRIRRGEPIDTLVFRL